MTQEWVDLDPQAVSNGLAKYDQASATLKANWQSTIAEIATKNTSHTWGTDEAGQKFGAEYEKGGAMDFGLPTGDPAKLIETLSDLGPDVRAAVENSLGADQAAASEMNIEVKGL